MSYYRVPYQVASWTPPQLSATEEVFLGQHVAAVGIRQMRHEFRRQLTRPDREHAGAIAAFEKLSLRQRLIRYAIVFVPLLAVFYFVPRFLAAAFAIIAFVCLMWYTAASLSRCCDTIAS